MTSQSIHPTRIQNLNDRDFGNGTYVLYWMQQSQRVEYNHALEYAIQTANHRKLGVVVGFGLTDDYPEANLRHYTFMLEGLLEIQKTLAEQKIKMVVRVGSPPAVALELGQKAALIVCDRGYLKHQKDWRSQVALAATCPVVQIESDAIIPVEATSPKAEYAARTIRPKIHKQLDDYLVPYKASRVKKSSLRLKINGLNLTNTTGILNTLALDTRVGPVTHFFKGGTSIAKSRFDTFRANKFDHYLANRNQPQTDDISHMSPYLHFGQISPLYLALQVMTRGNEHKETQAAYLEELIVRRELAINFVYYTPQYDRFACLPQWARKTLKQHENDQRTNIYTRSQLENSQTHDEYWNAAMQEMRITGFMHNYMRMYWGKKILEWSNTPAHAFRTTLALNNKYFLDGRDPNSYAGVAWVYGVHDRAWFERPIFGKVRYMAASGLERKCDIKGYVKKIDALSKRD